MSYVRGHVPDLRRVVYPRVRRQINGNPLFFQIRGGERRRIEQSVIQLYNLPPVPGKMQDAGDGRQSDRYNHQGQAAFGQEGASAGGKRNMSKSLKDIVPAGHIYMRDNVLQKESLTGVN